MEWVEWARWVWIEARVTRASMQRGSARSVRSRVLAAEGKSSVVQRISIHSSALLGVEILTCSD